MHGMEGHYILPRFFLFFRTPSSQVTQQNTTELCHMFGSEPDLKMGVKNLEQPSKTKTP